MTATLIATKFFIPTPRPNQVMRDRLHTRIKKGLSGRLTVVSAPAGFGKTTLVCFGLCKYVIRLFF
jgi:LuxR family maltose regulon positive regulatory protein